MPDPNILALKSQHSWDGQIVWIHQRKRICGLTSSRNKADRTAPHIKILRKLLPRVRGMGRMGDNGQGVHGFFGGMMKCSKINCGDG